MYMTLSSSCPRNTSTSGAGCFWFRRVSSAPRETITEDADRRARRGSEPLALRWASGFVPQGTTLADEDDGGGGDAGSTSGQTATSVASSYLNGSAHHHHHHHHGHHRRSVRSKSDTTGIGTPIYMAPEQRHGGRHSAKVDIYSLGVIVFECFHPFNTASERIITLQRLREGRMPAEVEPKIAKLVEWMMSPDASERPSAREILGCAILGGIGDPLRLATPSLTPLMADSGSGSGLGSGSTAMRRHSTMPTSSSTTAMTMSGELPREIGGGEQPDEHVARSDPLLLRGETRDN
eukprot:TRINITY_DN1056_c0_g1_i2.p1 TRINITY_DN1056_c0_g1~~TRINITY_DN1056_c0_g1_i2.p1  ORF type:complete len:293 (+),score=112.88 TRINITY_DN1056_c0_g1_i2:285-1163(+)